MHADEDIAKEAKKPRNFLLDPGFSGSLEIFKLCYLRPSALICG
jgi:hypothetical protein